MTSIRSLGQPNAAARSTSRYWQLRAFLMMADLTGGRLAAVRRDAIDEGDDALSSLLNLDVLGVS